MKLALIGSRPERDDNVCADRIRIEVECRGTLGAGWIPLVDCRFWPPNETCEEAPRPEKCAWWYPGEFGEFRCAS